MSFLKNKNNLIIFFILVLALILRLINLNTIEVSTDEGNYAFRAIGWNDFMMSDVLKTPWIWYSMEEKAPLWTQLSFFDHPPLHFATIWLATHILGVSLWAVRLPAVIYGVLSVLLTIIILKKINFGRGSLWAGLFLAVLPWHIYICQQAIQESGVIFWTLMTIYLLLRIPENKPIEISNAKKFLIFKSQQLPWILAGASFALAMLTKYSSVLILPLIAYWFFKKKWYKNLNFWFAPLTSLILLLPVIIYNFKTYLLRGHFDLQFSRALNQNTGDDYLSNQQGIWEGSIKSFFSFFSDLSAWIAITSALFIALGFLIIWNKRKELAKGSVFLSYGMILIVGFLCTITLSDYGRSSVIIPYVVLAVGAVASLKDKKIISLLIISLAILFSVSVADKLNQEIFSKKLASAFNRPGIGYEVWEQWLKENQPPIEAPKHYLSISDWFLDLSLKINKTTQPIIVFDQRMSWFPANWYFYRHSFYTQNYPVVHASFFAYLLLNKYINLDSKTIYYIQICEASADSKAHLDPWSEITEKIFKSLVEKQTPKPIILKTPAGENFLNIWPIKWDSALKLDFN